MLLLHMCFRKPNLAMISDAQKSNGLLSFSLPSKVYQYLRHRSNGRKSCRHNRGPAEWILLCSRYGDLPSLRELLNSLMPEAKIAP